MRSRIARRLAKIEHAHRKNKMWVAKGPDKAHPDAIAKFKREHGIEEDDLFVYIREFSSEKDEPITCGRDDCAICGTDQTCHKVA
jgi:precorrin-6B methylase 1